MSVQIPERWRKRYEGCKRQNPVMLGEPIRMIEEIAALEQLVRDFVRMSGPDEMQSSRWLNLCRHADELLGVTAPPEEKTGAPESELGLPGRWIGIPPRNNYKRWP